MKLSGGQYLAWGWQGGRYGGEYYQTVIWASVDGMTWLQTAVLEGLVLAVEAGGPGYLAVGSRAGVDFFGGALAWSSADGATWVDSGLTPAPATSAMTDLTPFQGGFVAVGLAGNDKGFSEGLVWSSQDGLAWAQMVADPNLTNTAISDVILAGGKLIAAGSFSVQLTSGQYARPAIWRSEAGATWTIFFERQCCGDVVDIVDWNGRLLAMFGWSVPRGPEGGAALVRVNSDSEWEMIGALPSEAGLAWERLLVTDEGVLVTGRRQLGDGTQQPVVLFPPSSL